MKKYVKPELFYEHYELSQHIADCDFEYIQAQDSCVAQGDVEDGFDWSVFNGNLPCTVEPDYIEGFCYHNDTNEGYNTFNS